VNDLLGVVLDYKKKSVEADWADCIGDDIRDEFLEFGDRLRGRM
jgi:hypothetical protein